MTATIITVAGSAMSTVAALTTTATHTIVSMMYVVTIQKIVQTILMASTATDNHASKIRTVMMATVKEEFALKPFNLAQTLSLVTTVEDTVAKII
jgi:hypothetical protein